ncbi:MAG: tetratricopeptide repeat protein [Hyphomicrobium sp.]|nr:tetratricopeptide repeat protein [Hyphomicrobium sp.]
MTRSVAKPITVRDLRRATAFLRCTLAVGAIIVVAQSLGAAYPGAALAANEQFPLNGPLTSSTDFENAEAQKLVDAGRAAYLAGQYQKAVDIYSVLIKLKPTDPRAYYNRGNAYARLKAFEKALADFNEALKISPNLYLALMNRANIFSQSKRFAEAIADYDQAILLNPDQFLIFYNRGIAFGRLGDYARAIRDLAEAIRLNPRDAPSYASRGDVFFEQRDFEKARNDYVKAIELDSSQKHAAERLRAMADARLPPAVRPTLDTSSVATEITHQNAVERLAQLAAQSCYQNGEDEQALQGLAAANTWTAVGSDELNRVSTAETTMVNGWTFTDAAGAVAVLQSKVKDAPGLYICSMTAKLLSPHMLDDFQAAFEKQFNTKPAGPIEKTADVTIRYWLPHTPTCDAKTTVVLSPERGTVTVRMLHGRKADGA